MRNLFKTISLVLCLFASHLAFAVEKEGGGGGGFCVNSTCVTLAEAGFRLKEKSFDKPVISHETFVEYEKIIEAIPITPVFKNILRDNTVGTMETYKVVTEYDDKAFEKYKQEYLKVLKDNDFPSDNFELFAVSDRSNTYLLPAFYKLSPKSQALLLFHEGVVRKKGNVNLALRLDGGILDSTKNQTHIYDVVYVISNFGEDFDWGHYEDGIRAPYDSFWAYLKESNLKNQGKPIDITDVLGLGSVVDMNAETAARVYLKDLLLWRIVAELSLELPLSLYRVKEIRFIERSWVLSDLEKKSIEQTCSSVKDLRRFALAQITRNHPAGLNYYFECFENKMRSNGEIVPFWGR
jgi:hypothetical protein